jgi:hypothetical protein
MQYCVLNILTDVCHITEKACSIPTYCCHYLLPNMYVGGDIAIHGIIVWLICGSGFRGKFNGSISATITT